MKRHTLVIGGTKGIGKALVRFLAKEGHILSVIGRSSFNGHDKKKNIAYYSVDISDSERLSKALNDIISKNGKLSNLVFFQRYRGDDDWIGELNLSLTATKKIIEWSVDKFGNVDSKSIVIISSLAGIFIVDEQPVSYHVAKAGINQLVRYYAVALADNGIRVNCVSPCTVLKEESEKFYLENKPLYDLYRKIIPIGRMCTSNDIDNLVAFLLSDKASFITGQNIIVDGGLSLQGHESLARKLKSLNNPKITRQDKK